MPIRGVICKLQEVNRKKSSRNFAQGTGSQKRSVPTHIQSFVLNVRGKGGHCNGFSYFHTIVMAFHRASVIIGVVFYLLFWGLLFELVLI